MSALLVGTLFLLGTAGASTTESPAIVGDYVEARSNHVYTCGCLFSGEQVTSGREAILAWSIKEGNSGGTTLAGVKVVAVLAAEKNLSTGITPVKTILYIDAATNDQHRVALDLFRSQYSKLFGASFVVYSAPIGFVQSPDRTSVTIPHRLRLVVRKAQLPEDAHPGSSLWYDPFVSLTAAMLGTTEHTLFSGKDLNRTWWENEAGITAYLGTFLLRPLTS